MGKKEGVKSTASATVRSSSLLNLEFCALFPKCITSFHPYDRLLPFPSDPNVS